MTQCPPTMRWGLGLVALAACGRIDFDPHPDADLVPALIDSASDAKAQPIAFVQATGTGTSGMAAVDLPFTGAPCSARTTAPIA